jgi:hypothetical protein
VVPQKHTLPMAASYPDLLSLCDCALCTSRSEDTNDQRLLLLLCRLFSLELPSSACDCLCLSTYEYVAT